MCLHRGVDPFHQANRNQLLSEQHRSVGTGIAHSIEHCLQSVGPPQKQQLHHSAAISASLHRRTQKGSSQYYFWLQMALISEVLLREGVSNDEGLRRWAWLGRIVSRALESDDQYVRYQKGPHLNSQQLKVRRWGATPGPFRYGQDREFKRTRQMHGEILCYIQLFQRSQHQNAS